MLLVITMHVVINFNENIEDFDYLILLENIKPTVHAHKHQMK
jgi:hypothetical protein